MTAPRFRAFHISGAAVLVDVPASPVGRIRLRSWRHTDKQDGGPSYYIGSAGCAVVLPTESCGLEWPGVHVYLAAGCYAQVPAGTRIFGGAGLVIHTPDYRGLAQAGGPVEEGGRLKYIDGCSDSLLICPALLGEPCLNYLHLPAGTAQTEHTHPSDRVGIIMRGRGVCLTQGERADLEPGMFWHIPPETPHSFHTAADSLDVLAWHPDSDFGPSHDAHPMVNRTIVQGVAATDARHAAIRTK